MQNNTIFGDCQPHYLIVLNKVDSTNDYLKQLLSNFKPLPPLTAIMAKMQTDGRGQRGTSWITVPGENLTVSIYIKSKSLHVSQQFLLTAMVSLAVCNTIIRYVPGKKVSIKWPNDIFIDNKKVCGILIENKISGNKVISSVIGIGLNVYQTSFSEELQRKATSLKAAGTNGSLSLVGIVREIQEHLRIYEQFLAGEKSEELLKEYNERLFQKDEISSYVLKRNLIQGRIIEVEEDGFLKILVDGELLKCDLKDIVYQL